MLTLQRDMTDESADVDDAALLAACDVLVMRALELIGKRVARVDRSRYRRLDGRDYWDAHTLWQPDADMLDKALDGAWSLVARIVHDHAVVGTSPRLVELALDRYVRDLVKGMRGHDVSELRYVLRAFT